MKLEILTQDVAILYSVGGSGHPTSRWPHDSPCHLVLFAFIDLLTKLNLSVTSLPPYLLLSLSPGLENKLKGTMSCVPNTNNVV